MTVVYRKDYAPAEFWIDRTELEFDLDPKRTVVSTRIWLRRNPDQSGDLELDGQDLTLRSVAIDGRLLQEHEFQSAADKLVIHEPPDEFVLATTVEIDPKSNKTLYGLYLSSGNFCTQCEALGIDWNP